MDTKESLQKCYKKYGSVTWRNILDPDYKLVEGYEINAFPTYVLLNQDGKHIQVKEGLKGMEDAVKRALGLHKKNKNEPFSPFQSLAKPINDTLIFNELIPRRDKLIEKHPKAWDNFDIEQAPLHCDLPAPIGGKAKTPNLTEITQATGIVVGGQGDSSTWTAGGVFVSAEGLFLTNHHVVSGKNEPVAVMTTDGKLYPITRILAAHKEGDVALLQIEGSGFPFVQLAPHAPKSGDDVILVHHSEERFYTYDRGYVRRHSFMYNTTYMEISAEYSTGGSGCGVFDKDHRLVGLVSTIAHGSKGKLTSPFRNKKNDGEFSKPAIIMRLASSWKLLRSLWR